MNEAGHIDLFSGIGGFAIAAAGADYTTRVFCERDPYCTRILNRHWPDVPVVRDVGDFDGTRWRGCRLLTGGFPCQPVSHCGLRQGSSDSRFLWKEMYRVICDAAPLYVLAENVPGILDIEGGVLFESVCADLEAAGYEVLSFVLPACSKNAPHQRSRVWIVAHASEQGLQGSEEAGHHGGDREKRGHEQFTGCSGVPRWDEFPTVSPVCGGDDGVANRIHRLKALGNSICWPVALELLKLTNPR